jgi:alcohol dehydrogenase
MRADGHGLPKREKPHRRLRLRGFPELPTSETLAGLVIQSFPTYVSDQHRREYTGEWRLSPHELGSQCDTEPMRAAIYHRFGGPISVEELPDPEVPADGVVIRVGGSGLCRSDLHGWDGHDQSIRLPHVPGHEMAGTIEGIGPQVAGFRVGDRVTVPFAVGCGRCEQCTSGNPQICDDDFQPGFTAWGSFAELVAIPRADLNLVRLPPGMELPASALLGCRFATAYRAIAQRGALRPGHWVAIHGCGGLGLSAVMIAVALEARVVAVDIREQALARARDLGAEMTVDGASSEDPAAVIRELTQGGAHLSLDSLGSPATASSSIHSLRKRGRHVQVGLLSDGPTPLPMDAVIARELEILGSHGLAAGDYAELLALIESGRVDPGLLVDREISLDQVPEELIAMRNFSGDGVAVVTRF